MLAKNCLYISHFAGEAPLSVFSILASYGLYHLVFKYHLTGKERRSSHSNLINVSTMGMPYNGGGYAFLRSPFKFISQFFGLKINFSLRCASN